LKKHEIIVSERKYSTVTVILTKFRNNKTRGSIQQDPIHGRFSFSFFASYTPAHHETQATQTQAQWMSTASALVHVSCLVAK
jgi:hypothetical protein